MVKIKFDINLVRNVVCENYKLICSILVEKRKIEKRFFYFLLLMKFMKYQKLFLLEVFVVYLVNFLIFNDIIVKSFFLVLLNMLLEKIVRRFLGFFEIRIVKFGKEIF